MRTQVVAGVDPQIFREMPSERDSITDLEVTVGIGPAKRQTITLWLMELWIGGAAAHRKIEVTSHARIGNRPGARHPGIEEVARPQAATVKIATTILQQAAV